MAPTPATAAIPAMAPTPATAATSPPPQWARPAEPAVSTALPDDRAEAAPTGTPAPAPSPRPSSTDDAGIDRLRAVWPEIVEVISQSPPMRPLIVECRPVSVDGALVTLGFPEDKAFLKDVLERRRPMLEDGIGRILGRAVNVRCVATNLEDVPAVPLGETADLISEAKRIFADDLADVSEVS
jgi:hypothetical protein